MRAMDWHVAQINVGRLRAPIDDPLIEGFVNALDEINALADGSPGFVWRLQDDGGNATAVRAYPDERVIVNVSVWASVEELAGYVYRTVHGDFLRRRREWFERYGSVVFALWWIPAGTVPSVAEAVARIDHLDRHGPTPHAFTFRQRFTPDEAPAADDARDACPA
jgi:hypothetical protein